MQSRRNFQKHLWLLSGTGEGPGFLTALTAQGWNVTVSVVSDKAALAYKYLPKEALYAGALKGPNAINLFLKEAKVRHQGFQLIVDATHPFASIISSDLYYVCKETGQQLVRYERNTDTSINVNLINTVSDLERYSFKGSNVMFALGVRSLGKAVASVSGSGVNIFARVLSTPENIRIALSASLSDDRLAVLDPLKGQVPGAVEEALCKKWSITDVVCRQSGGLTQELWQNISLRQSISLWMLAKPPINKMVQSVSNLEELLSFSAKLL